MPDRNPEKALLKLIEAQTCVVLSRDLLVFGQSPENGKDFFGRNDQRGQLEDQVKVVPCLKNDLILEFFLSQGDEGVLHEEIEKGLKGRFELLVDLLDLLVVVEFDDFLVGFLFDFDGFFVFFADFFF